MKTKTESLLSIHKALCNEHRLSGFDIKGDELFFCSGGKLFCVQAKEDLMFKVYRDGDLLRGFLSEERVIEMFKKAE